MNCWKKREKTTLCKDYKGEIRPFGCERNTVGKTALIA